MDENSLATNDEESGNGSTNENSQLLGRKKSQPKFSKGVAMSFGFKKRPTPMTTNGSTAIRNVENCATSANDPNGNKDETSNVPVKDQTVKEKHMHKTSSSQKPASITARPARFGFQSSNDRTNKVADIKTQSPTEFGGAANQNANKSKLTSPTSEQEVMSYDRRTRTFTRTVAKSESAQRRNRMERDNNENCPSVVDRLGDTPSQTGKFTFQTTRLPQPESIRVIETKTAKTIANNNKRFARIRQQFEEASLKGEALTEDSGFGSNTSGNSGEPDYTTLRYSDNRLQHSLRNNTFPMMENSCSISETGTPPPLPELPCVFRTNSPTSTNFNAKETSSCKDKSENKRPYLKLGTQRTFLKSRTTENHSSPQSSCEPDWITAGEAMAEDTGFSVSPMHRSFESKEDIEERCASTCTTVTEAVLQTLVKPSVSLELTQSHKPSQNVSILDEDPSFTAVAANSTKGHLLDEEILSPVESLLSCSESDEILKKKLNRSSSNSKDINEKLTPASPDTPTNGTYSLSLSDDKEDFLIDDEIADQPELVFEETIADLSSLHFRQDNTSTILKESGWNSRAQVYEVDNSPLHSRKRRDFLRSMTGSIESLSACESIGSDDLMMEYDISQSNDVDSCDRRSGSFSPVEDTSRIRLRTDDMNFPYKNTYKSSSSKPLVVSRTGTPNYIKDSPRSIRSRLTYQTPPENRSPKKTSLQHMNYHSVAYDPTSDCLMLTKANHSAIQQDIIGIKTMLLTLKRVLNETETRSTFLEDSPDNYEIGGFQNVNNNNNEFKVELSELRRQVLFLQGQLEDREETVNNLQKQIDSLANQKTEIVVDNIFSSSDIQSRCNAATQTERVTGEVITWHKSAPPTSSSQTEDVFSIIPESWN